MWRPMTSIRVRTAVLVLESAALRAGHAMACPFASSDEFEAAVIRSKLAAGVYGPKRRRRRMLIVGAAGSVLALLFWIV